MAWRRTPSGFGKSPIVILPLTRSLMRQSSVLGFHTKFQMIRHKGSPMVIHLALANKFRWTIQLASKTLFALTSGAKGGSYTATSIGYQLATTDSCFGKDSLLGTSWAMVTITFGWSHLTMVALRPRIKKQSLWSSILTKP